MTDLQLDLQQDLTTNGQFTITRFDYKWLDFYIWGGGFVVAEVVFKEFVFS